VGLDQLGSHSFVARLRELDELLAQLLAALGVERHR
jgi:hypothetical protein